jgi:hypothetical protein
LGICTTGGVNAEVVGAIVERTRQRQITGVSFVCVCVFSSFFVILVSLSLSVLQMLCGAQQTGIFTKLLL